MNLEFRQWTQLTDVYADRLNAAACGDPSAWADLKHLAVDLCQQSRAVVDSGDEAGLASVWGGWQSDPSDSAPRDGAR